MQTQILYQFESAQVANRFLNTLSNWSGAGPATRLRAKLYRGSERVLVSYEFDGVGFDATASELDDLASQLGGSEEAL